MIDFNLSRPKSKLPDSYFWTWDHSANWMLDDPGMLNFGCSNKYLKKPETFLVDYTRLIDFTAGLGIRGIVIFGFLRDSHGGEKYSKKICDHAVKKGVRIIPGIGTSFYGGVYYEGMHRYNLETFLKKNPEARMKKKDGSFNPRGACSTHPLFLEWLGEGLNWLFHEFKIGGVNLENGDFMVCNCKRCKEQKETWPENDPDYFRLQALSYIPAVRALRKQLGNKPITYVTYTGFVPRENRKNSDEAALAYTPNMGSKRPEIFNRITKEAYAQWTLTGMVKRSPLPLHKYLDNGNPEEAYNNNNWPDGLVPPAEKNTGFIHQGSQWMHEADWNKFGRYNQVVSTIKESCLRGAGSGLSGISMHGEVTSRHIPAALNYLAFSHFTHWPGDSLRGFGKKTLGQVLGSEKAGELFAEYLAYWEAGSLNKAQIKDIRAKAVKLEEDASAGKNMTSWRFWTWLSRMASGIYEPHTANLF